jgi:monovalent cation:H+ antiporter-2, CPA2 family
MGENIILSDLGVIAVASALAAIVFDRIRFPVILGYILVGLLLGPFLFSHHFIQNRENVQSLSELGVIFLLFTLGMDFDLKKLQHLVSTSMVALILQTVVMIYIGIQTAPLLGHDKVIGIFLGSLLAISSSMVTIRVLRDQKAMKLPHAQLAIGILILEDVLAILMLVVLSGISASGSLPWNSALWTIFILGVFVVGVFYVGRIVMPPIIKIVHQIGSLELVTLFAVGTVLGIGVLAEQFHLSLGLGAFVAGSLFTNSTLSDKIEQSIAPLKELFSAVFFVSTGMLINPTVVIEQWPVILLLAFAVVVGKTASCGIGLFLAGQKAQSSFQAALVKSQIGEFSFIIAKLAQNMGLADEKLVSIAVGVSFLTILTTPIVSKNALPLYRFFALLTPRPITQFANVYHHIYCSFQTLLERSHFFFIVKRPFWQIIVSFFLINGMIIAANIGSRYAIREQLLPQLDTYLVMGIWLLTAVLVAPFLLSILRNIGAMSLMLVDLIFTGTKTLRKMSGTFKQFISHFLSILLVFLVGGTFITALTEFLPSGYSLILFALLIVILALAFQRQMIKLNSELEHRFASSFNVESKHIETKRRIKVLEKFKQEFDWNSLTTEKEIEHGSMASGKQIAELDLREKSGATIVAISRGDETIYDPNPLAHMFEGDRLILLGNEEQLAKASEILSIPKSESTMAQDNTFLTEAVYIESGCFLEGNTLAGSELRNKHRITVIGIKRGGNAVTDPKPSEVLKVGDLLLVMGKSSQVKAFKRSLYKNETVTHAAA